MSVVTKNKTNKIVPKKVEEKDERLEDIFGSKIATAIVKYSKEYGVDRYLLAALIVAENSGVNDKSDKAVEKVGDALKENPNRFSKRVRYLKFYKKGKLVGREIQSLGMLQLTKRSFNQIKKTYEDKTRGDTFWSVATNYNKSIKYAALYLSYIKNLVEKNNISPTKDLLAAAYNMGPTKLIKLAKEHKGEWIAYASNTAKDYVKKINAVYEVIAPAEIAKNK